MDISGGGDDMENLHKIEEVFFPDLINALEKSIECENVQGGKRKSKKRRRSKKYVKKSKTKRRGRNKKNVKKTKSKRRVGK